MSNIARSLIHLPNGSGFEYESGFDIFAGFGESQGWLTGNFTEVIEEVKILPTAFVNKEDSANINVTGNSHTSLQRINVANLNSGTLSDAEKAFFIGEALNDTLDGAAGNETLIARQGNDSLNGGDGNDSLNGAAGNDAIDAGNGDDTLIGGADRDNLIAGEDTIDDGAII